MLERKGEYVQIFGQEHLEDVKRYEPFKGRVQEAIEVLEKSLKDKKAPIYIPVYRSYEIMKAAVNGKIHITYTPTSSEYDLAMKAVHLSQDLMLSCFRKDNEDALGKLKEFKKLIMPFGSKEGTHLRKMLLDRVEEKPDLAFMPSCIEEEDYRIAEKLFEQTNGDPFLMVALGYRGSWRTPEIFYELLDLSKDSPNFKHSQPDSVFYLVRFSPFNYNDRIPRISAMENDFLRKQATGRKIILVGPKERLLRAERYLNQTCFMSDGKLAEIIQAPLKLTESNGKK